MAGFDVDGYALSLLKRVGEAAVVGHAGIEGGDWQPKHNMCHHNATDWCELQPEFTPVRGWLYFDPPGLPCAKFVARSIVRTPGGDLIDIAPSDTTQDYPFLVSRLSDDKYAHVVEELGFGELHAPKAEA